MNYLTNLFGGGNAAGGMRMPQMGQGMDLYGGKPSMNLGMGSVNRFANTDTGTGVMPSSLFGQMPAGFDFKSVLGSPESLASMKSLLDEKEKKDKQPELQPVQLPMGSNQSYDELIKMYGIRSGGLLG